jgi:type II secretory pathway component PulF
MSLLGKFEILIGKHDFKTQRGEIYNKLEANLSITGSGKIATTAEIFDSWAQRANNRRDPIGLVYRQIAKNLHQGQDFSRALSRFIPKDEQLILAAGDKNGKLKEALQAAATQKKASSEIGSLVLAAMSEPAMSILMISITSWFCGKQLWPEMLKIVSEQYWPAWALYWIKGEIFFAAYWQLLFLIGVLVFLYLWSIPRWSGHIRSVFDKIPPWSVYRDRQSASFLGVLGGLLDSGMELDDALAQIERAADPWLKWHVRVIRRRLSVVGANPLKSLDSGLFSKGVMDLIEDASRNRSFDATLVHMSSDALPIIIKKVSVMAKSTGVILTLCTGLIFAYQVYVQQAGTQKAMSAYGAAMQAGAKH